MGVWRARILSRRRRHAPRVFFAVLAPGARGHRAATARADISAIFLRALNGFQTSRDGAPAGTRLRPTRLFAAPDEFRGTKGVANGLSRPSGRVGRARARAGLEARPEPALRAHHRGAGESRHCACAQDAGGADQGRSRDRSGGLGATRSRRPGGVRQPWSRRWSRASATRWPRSGSRSSGRLRAAAEIRRGRRAYAKKLMAGRRGVPTAAFGVFEDVVAAAEAFIDAQPGAVVVRGRSVCAVAGKGGGRHQPCRRGWARRPCGRCSPSARSAMPARAW